MNEIKFTNHYTKFPFPLAKISQTILLEVFVKNREDLHPSFVHYDTKFRDSEEHYVLPKGKVLVLLMQSSPKNALLDLDRKSSAIWTTIRRWTPEKEEHYKSLCGKEIKAVMTR